MARSEAALAAPLDEAPRPPHPLRAWRERQRIIDPRSKGEPRHWTIADAARKYSDFIGRDVPYQTWMAWELYRNEPRHRIPNFDDMRGIFEFTAGAVTADHFYLLEGQDPGGG